MDAKKVEELRQSVEFRKFASYMVWNQAPDKALADMPAFLVHLMARCPEGACRYARDNFGLTEDDFREAFLIPHQVTSFMNQIGTNGVRFLVLTHQYHTQENTRTLFCFEIKPSRERGFSFYGKSLVGQNSVLFRA